MPPLDVEVSNMNKREQEEYVLKRAEPLLGKLYGKFSVDPDQTDRPDAAITVYKPHKRFGCKAEPFRVGIEITTVDKGDDLAYLNDEKHFHDKVVAQRMDALINRIDSDQPTKKVDIKIPTSYIYDGAIRKAGKYHGYFESGTYRQIILLCFSNRVATGTEVFNEHLLGWTNYFLSRAQFPFDAVVFASLKSGNPVRLYQKSKPLLVPPPPSSYPDLSETVVHFPTMRTEQSFNLKKIMPNAPLIEKRPPKPDR